MPALAAAVAVLMLITAGVMRGRLGSWRVPVLVTSVLAILLACGMLLISIDFGGGDCPAGTCGEQTPTSIVPSPG
jgi:hypothetical protein